MVIDTEKQTLGQNVPRYLRIDSPNGTNHYIELWHADRLSLSSPNVCIYAAHDLRKVSFNGLVVW
jgi:hypothetical protein